MNAQSAKTPTPRESVTITLTLEEQDFVIWALDCYFRVTGSKVVLNLVRKIEFFKKSGDACLHSAQSPDAVGQGDSIICHHCDGDGTYTKPSFLKLFQCDICRGTGSTLVDSVGQGGN